MPQKELVNLEAVKGFLANIAGEYAYGLVKICNSKKKVNDEFIANKIGLKITEVRAILNKLHYRGVAYYDKKHDVRSGWYSYTWSINNKRIADLIVQQLSEEIQRLESKVDFEKNYSFFGCRKACENFPFEIAAEYQFKCPQCGETMNPINNKKRLYDINKKIADMRGEMRLLERACK